MADGAPSTSSSTSPTGSGTTPGTGSQASTSSGEGRSPTTSSSTQTTTPPSPATPEAGKQPGAEAKPPKPGSKAWDDAAIERIRKAAERKAAEAAKPPEPAPETKPDPEKPKAEEKPRKSTEELLAKVRAERERHEEKRRAQELEKRIQALEPEAKKAQQFHAAIEAGDIKAALTALGFPKERWYTGEKSLYWQLAQLAGNADETEEKPEAKETKGLTKDDLEKWYQERREQERKDEEKRRNDSQAERLRKENAAGSAFADELNVHWETQKDTCPIVTAMYPDGLPFEHMKAFFRAEREKGTVLEPETFWPALEAHWRRQLKLEADKPKEPATEATATTNGAALKQTPGGVPEIKTMKIPEFDAYARERLEKLGKAS